MKDKKTNSLHEKQLEELIKQMKIKIETVKLENLKKKDIIQGLLNN